MVRASGSRPCGGSRAGGHTCRHREARRRKDLGLLSLYGSSRRQVERAEEDKREREKKMRENDIRLTATFEAFHSVDDAGHLRSPIFTTAAHDANGVLQNSSLSPSESSNSHPFSALSTSFSPDAGGLIENWPDFRRSNNIGSQMPPLSTPVVLDNHSTQSFSYSYNEASSEISRSLSSRSSDFGTQSALYSPAMAGVNSIAGGNMRHLRPFSPTEGDPYSQNPLFNAATSNVSNSSSVTSSRGSTGSSIDDEPSYTKDSFFMNNKQGSISPQLPSPESGGSGARSNASDQNPPVSSSP